MITIIKFLLLSMQTATILQFILRIHILHTRILKLNHRRIINLQILASQDILSLNFLPNSIMFNFFLNFPTPNKNKKHTKKAQKTYQFHIKTHIIHIIHKISAKSLINLFQLFTEPKTCHLTNQSFLFISYESYAPSHIEIILKYIKYILFIQPKYIL